MLLAFHPSFFFLLPGVNLLTSLVRIVGGSVDSDLMSSSFNTESQIIVRLS